MIPILLCWLLAVGTLVAVIARLLAGPEHCPSCRARAVRTWWVPRSPPEPTHHFHRCERCGLRLRRLFPGDWEDAAGPEFNGYYDAAPPLASRSASYRRER